MQLPYLEHSSTRAYIGLNANRPHLRIRQQQADLQIKQEHMANVKLEITHGELQIDQSAAFADADLKGILQRNREFIQKSKQIALENLAKASQEGDKLMRIEHGYQKIQKVSADKSELKHYETNIALVPKPFQVKIDYQPGTVKVRAGEAPLQINATPHKPDIQFQKWQTDTYIRQKNSLNFRVVGLNVNKAL